MEKDRYINSVNLNAGSRFPYLVLNMVDNQSTPRNPGFQVMHWHEDLQFIAVSDGRVAVQTLDETVEAGAGEGVFINADVIHYVRKIGTCRYRSFIFPAAFLTFFPGSPAESLVTRVTENPDIHLIRFSPDTEWNRGVLSLLFRLSSLEDQAKDETYPYEVLSVLSQLWLMLIRNLRLPAKEKVSASHRRMQKILQYIAVHFSEPITLEDLARSASISKSECGRVFRVSLQRTPYQYLMEYRMKRASDLLEETDLPIGTIGETVGFSQVSHFGHCFRKRTGLTPSAYRRAHRKKNGWMGFQDSAAGTE